MNQLNYLLIFITCFSLMLISCKNQIKKDLWLPAVFSDHMVLQQQEEAAFWGVSTPGDQVIVKGTWGEKVVAIPDQYGKWELQLPTPSAGGPFEVDVENSDTTIHFEDVMIGEVWLASGQSNMEWRFNQCKGCLDNQTEEIANANYNDIRMFTVPMDLTGKEIRDSNWKVSTPDNVGNSNVRGGASGFSAVAYFFARRLHKDLDVPIGIINSSWGGTRVEAWTSSEKLKSLNATKGKVLDGSTNFFGDFQKVKIYNDSINQLNEEQFGFASIEMPAWSKGMEDWEHVDLNDLGFSKTDYSDPEWPSWEPKIGDAYNSDLKGSFEAVYPNSNELLSNGVIWFRTTINIEHPDEDYHLIVEEGIDDADQTYFNGRLIGNTFGWNSKREYKIPKELVKKGENVLAIRITDNQGGGGFRSPVLFSSASRVKTIPFSVFKFRHHAFILNSQIVTHGLSNKELLDRSEKINEDFHKGIQFNDPNAYSILYHQMLSPVIPYNIKGAIWYQGESNVGNYKEYNELFNGMIEDWRTSWGSMFPFHFVQIAPYIYNPSANSQGLRDAQRQTLSTTPNTGMAIITDIGEEMDIHPSNKQDVGNRLAILALDKNYGRDMVSSGPLYKSHKVMGNSIEVDFTSIGSGLMTSSVLKDFEIAGEDNVFYNASAIIMDNKVSVSSTSVPMPVHVRYGWKNWFVGTLFNKEGLPASSFTSDRP